MNDAPAFPRDAFRLDGKTAIVFGIGPAIGNHAAMALAAAGANVVVCARTRANVDALVQAINAQHGPAALGVYGDVDQQSSIDEVLAAADTAFGAIDVVVYNAYALDAGHKQTFSNASIFDTTDEDWEACFRTNMLAPYRIARAAVPRMQERGGVFIHCLAAAAYTPIMPAIAYGSTKAALATMTTYLAKACGPNIRFNAISPSNIEVAERPEHMRNAALSLPLQRMGLAEEAAAAIVYLASPAAAFTTGQVLFVDGGRIATR